MTRRSLVPLACAIVLAVLNFSSIAAQTAPEPIRYTLRFPAPQTHYVEVEAIYPTGGRADLDLFMAVWTPGSYLVREYERHVENVSAKADGRSRPVEKTRKNRWRVRTGGARAVTVSYRVYGREMTVRNNWIEAGFAMINGAPTFLTLVDRTPRPHEVRVELPPAWNTTASPLNPIAGAANAFRAEDFDELVDSPLICGNPVIREFEVAGKRHYLVLEGDPSFFDTDRAAADAKKIVEAAGTIFGGRYEYPRYYFQTLVTDAGGGIEHKNSTMLMTGRFTTRNPRSYLVWNGLVAHEYFHNWNVKRLRPIELGPFDYETEVLTKSLWIAEGFTEYYGGIVVRRAGLQTRDEYLEELSDNIEQVQTRPGRLVTSVGMASYDTWIKHYRPDENTPNTSIDYYPKGAVIAFLLDAKIRKATNGTKSLDDAMRLAYDRYSGAKGYTLDQFYKTMSEVAGFDFEPWFHSTVDTTDELHYAEALSYFGLRFRPVDAKNARPYLGVVTRTDTGRLLISQVRRGTPAHDAGLNVDDEILAIDDVRVRVDGLNTRLDLYRPGDTIAFLVARRDRLTRVPVTLGADPGRPWRLEVAPDASVEQQNRLEQWLRASQ